MRSWLILSICEVTVVGVVMTDNLSASLVSIL